MHAARQIRLWSFIHKWSSLICTVFILLLCLTGLPLVFHDEIDSLIEAKTTLPIVTANSPKASPDQILAEGRKLYPIEYPQYLFWPDDEPNVVNLGMAPHKNPPPDEIHTLVMDVYAGARISEKTRQTGVMQIVLKLHSELLLGLGGTLFVGGMGLSFVLSLISGLVLYAPFMRRLAFGSLRLEKSAPTRWLDLHNLLGIVILMWTLVVGLTGIVNTLEKPLFAMWRAEQLPKLLAPYEGKPQPEKLSSVDAALATTAKAVPEMQVVSILFPYSTFNSPRHFLIWTKGKSVLTKHLFTAVLVDAENGALSAVLPLPWYLRALELSRPLHFGDYGGLPLKVIWAIFDLMTIGLLISGLLIWRPLRTEK